MRIEIEKSLLRLHPETPEEAAGLDRLWKLVVGCVAEGKKLVPVGQYLPGTSPSANFSIE